VSKGEPVSTRRIPRAVDGLALRWGAKQEAGHAPATALAHRFDVERGLLGPRSQQLTDRRNDDEHPSARPQPPETHRHAMTTSSENKTLVLKAFDTLFNKRD
jgi:hypothetical protein